MAKQATKMETNLAEYLKTGIIPFDLALCMDEGDPQIHEMVEIAIVPELSKSNLDDIWIGSLDDARLGATLRPGENLTRFFRFINVHPRDVLTESHLSMKPAKMETYYTDSYREYVNRNNAEVVRQYLDLLTDFEVDPLRASLCDPETARIVMDNASYGGYPLIAGWARVSEILDLDFDKPITVGGLYQVGIWDSLNGSGHMESASPTPVQMALSRRDLIVCSTKGWTPDASCGFVGKYYRLELQSQLAYA